MAKEKKDHPEKVIEIKKDYIKINWRQQLLDISAVPYFTVYVLRVYQFKINCSDLNSLHFLSNPKAFLILWEAVRTHLTTWVLCDDRKNHANGKDSQYSSSTNVIKLALQRELGPYADVIISFHHLPERVHSSRFFLNPPYVDNNAFAKITFL